MMHGSQCTFKEEQQILGGHFLNKHPGEHQAAAFCRQSFVIMEEFGVALDLGRSAGTGVNLWSERTSVTSCSPHLFLSHSGSAC